MPFEKGHEKYGGRKKGTPNKKKIIIHEVLDEIGCDPIREMALLAQSTKDENLKFQCYKELAQYIYAKQRAVVVSHEGDGDETPTPEQIQTFEKFLASEGTS